MCNVIGLPHFNSEHNPCSLCLANNSTMPHNNWAPSAPWRGTEVTNLLFKARLRRPLHPLAGHEIFNVQTYRHDLLHMADHHGVISHICANILWTHLSGDRLTPVLPGDNIEERIGFLNADLAAYYSANHVENRLPPFRAENIKDGPFPELKGNNIKAANTRSLVPYIVSLSQPAVSMQNSELNRHMLKIVSSVHGINEVIYRAGVFLSPSELAEVESHVNRLGRHYQKLSTDSFNEGQTRWKTTTKFHYYVGHLAQQAALINPCWVQGYSSESMVGTTAQIYSMCQNGPFHARVQRVVMQKYRIGLRLLMDS